MIELLPEKIKQHILNTVNNQFKKDPDRISVTEILYCLRKAYLRRINPKPIPLNQAWRIYIGTIIHRDLERLYDDEDKKFEIPIYNTGAVLVGKYDILDGDTIYELKVVDDNYDYFLSKNGPSKEYVEQLQFYMHNKKKKGKLAYLMHKKVKIIDVDSKDFDINKLLRRALILWEAIKEKKPPGKTLSKWQCKTCEYKEECMKLG